eukprot:jgi/Bigna1/143625/aug1.80_g18333
MSSSINREGGGKSVDAVEKAESRNNRDDGDYGEEELKQSELLKQQYLQQQQLQKRPHQNNATVRKDEPLRRSSVIEKPANPEVCGNCEGDDAVIACADCGEVLCEDCDRDIHRDDKMYHDRAPLYEPE